MFLPRSGPAGRGAYRGREEAGGTERSAGWKGRGERGAGDVRAGERRSGVVITRQTNAGQTRWRTELKNAGQANAATDEVFDYRGADFDVTQFGPDGTYKCITRSGRTQQGGRYPRESLLRFLILGE